MGRSGKGFERPNTQVIEGFFDPARHTSRLLVNGLEVRDVGDMTYSQLPAGTTPDGKRWVAARRVSLKVDQPLPPIAVVKVGLWDPQAALALLRSAFSVRLPARGGG